MKKSVRNLSKKGIKPIIYGIGSGFLEMRYQGVGFLECATEPIKNSRDWGATKIIITTSDPSEITFVDNGVGMAEGNRDSFVSINLTTATGKHQSGKFDTGAKMMLLAFADRFQVVTFPKDEPDEAGYMFGCSRKIYEQRLFSKASIIPEVIQKPSKNWPYEFKTGSAITYSLDNPKRKSILRGNRLAKLLAARLPFKFHSIVEVDGEPIPEKEIIGDVYRFSQTINDSILGHIEMELYRPKNPTPQDMLWFGGVEIGEVSIDNFYRALDEDLRGFFPSDFLMGICGTISCDLIKRHTNEDRKSLSDHIKSDPAIIELIRIMREHLDPIKQALQIRTGNRKDHKADEGELELLRQRFNKKFDPENEGPPQVRLGGRKPVTLHPVPDEKSGPAISLHGFREEKEYELGEFIEVYATLRNDLQSDFEQNGVAWHTENSGCSSIKIKGNSIKMKATTVGECELVVDLSGTLHSATAHYKIVERRFFKLSPPMVKIYVGESVTIRAQNIDKLSPDGKISWSLTGTGQFETKDSRTVVYHATEEDGEAILSGIDTQNKDIFATCQIAVNFPRPKNSIKIGDHWFLFDITDMDKPGCPASMLLGGVFHQLFFNRRTAGWEEAKADGRLAEFLGQAAAMVYPGFRRFVLNENEEFDASELINLSRLYYEMVDEGYQIFLGTFKTTIE